MKKRKENENGTSFCKLINCAINLSKSIRVITVQW